MKGLLAKVRNRERGVVIIWIAFFMLTMLGFVALGIDWTTVRRDDPFNRGFEYVPFSGDDVYGPINELWG